MVKHQNIMLILANQNILLYIHLFKISGEGKGTGMDMLMFFFFCVSIVGSDYFVCFLSYPYVDI
jgi:hypothetical protein